MPSRHAGSSNSSEISIGEIKDEQGKSAPVVVWDIIAHGYFEKTFSNHPDMRIEDFNIAYLFFIVPLLAFLNPASRRTALLLLSGIFLTLIAITHGGKLYPFLFEHVFLFRYMRMMHLFLWLGVLPIAILLVMDQLRVFLKQHQGRKNIKVLIFIIVIHCLFFLGLFTQPGVSLSSYISVGMSLLFFIQAILGYWGKDILSWLLWLSIIIQPIEIAVYMNSNSIATEPSYLIDRASFYLRDFSLPTKISVMPQDNNNKKKGDLLKVAPTQHYVNPWLDHLQQLIYVDNIRTFVANKLLLFDNTIPEENSSSEQFYIKLDNMLGALQNHVFLPIKDSVPEDFKSLAPNILNAKVLVKGSAEVKILYFDANALRLKTNLNQPKFLLWTDGYHPEWHIYIDGRESRLLRADYAFKGAWIPSGEHTVVFRFLTPLQYTKAYILLFSFMFALAMIVILGFKEKFLIEKEEACEH
ncbi:MAG: YfhO family protein [Candidatus Omnitrophica bacterium]|nr:YfhO family protein [Candidatus Omnitrophota bacterium]